MMYPLFAHDTNLFMSGKDVVKLQQEVEIDFNIIEWLKSMNYHWKKNHFMVFSNKKVSKPDLQISIDGHSVDGTDHTKVLGMIIDSKLNWKNNISHS